MVDELELEAFAVELDRIAHQTVRSVGEAFLKLEGARKGLLTTINFETLEQARMELPVELILGRTRHGAQAQHDEQDEVNGKFELRDQSYPRHLRSAARFFTGFPLVLPLRLLLCLIDRPRCAALTRLTSSRHPPAHPRREQPGHPRRQRSSALCD